MARKKAGWFGESARHSLASKGVKTSHWLPKRYKRQTPATPYKQRESLPKTPYDIPGFDVGEVIIHDNARDIDKATLDDLLYRFERADWGKIDQGDQEMQEMMVVTSDLYHLPGTINGVYPLDDKRSIVIHHPINDNYTEVWCVRKKD